MVVFLIVSLGVSGSLLGENSAAASNPSIITSSDPALSHSLKFKVHFNGSLLVEYTVENATHDLSRPTIDGSINFTRNGDYVSATWKITLPLPSPIPFNVSVDTTPLEGELSLDRLSGEGTYADRVAEGTLVIYPSVKLLGYITIPMDPITMEYEITESSLSIELSTVIHYLPDWVNYTVVSDLLDYAELMGFNQSFINSTVYYYSNGVLECSDLTLNCVDAADHAEITSSVTVDGNFLEALPHILANLLGLPSPGGAAEDIASKIDAALDLVVSSSYTLSTTDNLLVHNGTAFFVSTFDSDLTELKNDVLDEFPPAIEAEKLDFLYETDLKISGISVRYSSDPDKALCGLEGFFLQPPVHWADTTEFTIPELFTICRDIFPENLTSLTIEGERNATFEVMVIVPPGAPEPSSQSSVTWTNVNPSHLSGVTFKIVSLALLTLEDVFRFAAISGLIAVVVIIAHQYRKKPFITEVGSA